jgi:amino acid permease
MLLMFIAASLVAFGLHLLTVAAGHTGRKSSFAALCQITYPRAAFAFEAAVAVKCIGAAVAYLSIIAETAGELMENWTGAKASWATSRPFCVIIAALVIAPVCLMRKMDSLKYTSFAGMAAVFYLVLLTVWNYTQEPDASFADNISLVTKPSVHMLKAYGIFVFAFTCHQNILPIQNEARNNSPSAMMRIISFSVSLSTILYMLVSVFGYATYGTDLESSILKNFPKNMVPFIAARIFYVFLLLFSYPLQVFPCRLCIQKMATMINEEKSLINARSIYLISTAAIIGSSAFLAALPFSLDTVMSLVGSTSGTFICYFLPAIIYNKLSLDKPFDARRVGAWALVFAGIVTFLISITSNMLSIIAAFKGSN